MSTAKRKLTNASEAIPEKAQKGASNEEKEKKEILTSPYFDEGQSSKSNSETLDFDSSKRLTSGFYRKSCVDLAKSLLGQVLVRKCPSTNKLLCGRIVETEAYVGVDDKAAHSYKGKVTEKNSAMFMDPGTAYVYNIYGMYCCMNISSEGEGAAVLLRALEPVHGLEKMEQNRNKRRKEGAKPFKSKELCNGPSKLCDALNISKPDINKQDLTSSPDIWLVAGEKVEDSDVVVTTRINISYGEEWVGKPLRFYELNNNCVSVRDKKSEEKLKS